MHTVGYEGSQFFFGGGGGAFVVVTTGGLGFGGGGGAGASVVVVGGCVVVVVVVGAANVVVVGSTISGACGLGASVPQAVSTSDARRHSGIRRLKFTGDSVAFGMHDALRIDTRVNSVTRQHWNVIPRHGERGL
jgi:hypothetical protein